MTAKRWSSREPGRSEVEWLRAIPWADARRVDVGAAARQWSRVIVVAPHPDDETLAAGGLIAALSAAGVRVDIVLVTDGEASHSRSATLARDVIRRVRAAEFDAAVRALGVEGEVVRLHVPDGAVRAHADAVEQTVGEMLRGAAQAEGNAETVLVVAPWANDGHTDHDSAGIVAQRAAAAGGVGCVFYPLWAWHWAGDDEFDWASTVLAPLSIAALEAKAAAIEAYASQTGTFGQPIAEPALLHERVMRRFERVVETLIDPDGVLPTIEQGADSADDRGAPFDAMFADGDDPWGVETRWYERRRQALIEAMLPREALGRVLDIGCSTGVLTAALAERATSVVGVDASERALDVARRERGADDTVEWRHAALPSGLADVDGPFDLIVLSEVGYFFDGPDLMTLFAHVDRLLASDGAVVTANWQHPTQNIPLDGRLVDRQFRALWPPTARYEDADVVVTLHDRAAEGER